MGSKMATDMKQVVKSNKNDMTLHVALIMKSDEISKSDALVVAYAEGVSGLRTRLNPAGVPK